MDECARTLTLAHSFFSDDTDCSAGEFTCFRSVHLLRMRACVYACVSATRMCMSERAAGSVRVGRSGTGQSLRADAGRQGEICWKRAGEGRCAHAHVYLDFRNAFRSAKFDLEPSIRYP